MWRSAESRDHFNVLKLCRLIKRSLPEDDDRPPSEKVRCDIGGVDLLENCG